MHTSSFQPRLGGRAFAVATLAFASFLSQAPAQSSPAPAAPPVAPVRTVTTDYYGNTVTDPYRYMENLSDPDVAAWFKGQDAYTRGVLAKIPGRDALLARIKELDTSTPAIVRSIDAMPGGRYFYQKTLPSEIVAKLYVRDGLDGTERLLLDPDKYPAPAGSHNAISDYAPSMDGKLVGVAVSAGGSEVGTIHILDVNTGKELPETIDRVRFGSVQFLPDGHAFTYNRLQKLAPGQPATEFEEKSTVYLHVLGTPVDSDKPILGFGVSPRVDVSPTDLPFVVSTLHSKWAIGMLFHGVLNEHTYLKAPIDSLDKPDIPWEKICDTADDITSLAVHGTDLYLLSHLGAPHYKVLRTSLDHPDVAHAVTVIPESDAVINSIATAEDALYAQQTNGMVGELLRLAYDGGAPQKVQLPFQGSVSIESSDERIPGVLLTMASWVRAPRTYNYDPQTRTVTDTKLLPVGPYGDPQDIVSEEVMVKSWDGVMVPLSIMHKRGIPMDGSNPTLLWGYGAYGISEDPSFSPIRLAWLEKGGVLAVAHPRGGGELGEDWHKWGEKLTKPNTWRDFIACGEYLIAAKYTSPEKLGGQGGSAGGITVGRAYTERPDLFAAALDDVGLSDALRFEEMPNGPPNIPEFGSTKTQWGFEDLYAMDSYHHVRDGVHYPAILLTTGWNDPRVAPWEPGKMTARLQAATAGGKPILLRVDYAGGHGIGSTREQHDEVTADEWSFLFWQFGVAGFQP
jgi:prolyl oligopeptidase